MTSISFDETGQKDDLRGNMLLRVHRNQRIGRSVCFLCGARITHRNRSVEHVVPKWVLRRFDLWDASVTLLNGHAWPYRHLTIPCCKKCNGVHLARIERDVQRAVADGFEGMDRLSRETLFLWLGKICYGLLYKENLMRRDPRGGRRRRLVPRAYLTAFETHHQFLQGIRLPVRWATAIPASILVVPVQAPSEPKHCFDLRDHQHAMTISIRLGDVGVIAALQDGGVQRDEFFPLLERYRTHPLHPLQFIELTVEFFYKVSLARRFPSFATIGTPTEVQVMQIPFGPDPNHFRPWNNRVYAQLLSKHIGLPVQELYDPDLGLRGFLKDDTGQARWIPLSEQPWPIERRAVAPPPPDAVAERASMTTAE